jgi:CSLREA domain-containing protein
MLFCNWPQTLKTTFQGTASRKYRRGTRPTQKAGRKLLLDALEDRLAPATLTVNTTADVVNPSDGTLTLRDAIIAINAGWTEREPLPKPQQQWPICSRFWRSANR